MAQSVEHVIGNDEVISSILITSSKNPNAKDMDDCKKLRGLPLSSVVCFVSQGGE